MPAKKILAVIGALSIDSIFSIGQMPERGACVRSKKHKELGGRGANIAIAAYRSFHKKPGSLDGLLELDDPGSDDALGELIAKDDIEVRLIGAVDNDERRKAFETLLRQNGVKADGVRVFDDYPEPAPEVLAQRPYSEEVSIVDGETGRARQMFTPGVADRWEPEHFDEIEKLGAGVKPDLVVTTMELRREVVEMIINTAWENNVEIIVYGSPATQVIDVFPKITHYICNEGDAAILLGYDKGDVYWDTWKEVTENLRRKGVKNVVLTLGPAGVYFSNEHDEGYVSGYRKLREIEDSSGLTAAFAGAYAISYLKSRGSSAWNIQAAAVRGVKASALKVLTIGSRQSLPWADEIDALQVQPLFESLDDLLALAGKARKGDRKFIFQRTFREGV